MLMKIMFAPAVLCSSGPVPCSVAADDVEAEHADDIYFSIKGRKRILSLNLSQNGYGLQLS